MAKGACRHLIWFERALFVAALIAFAGSIVAFVLVRQEEPAGEATPVEIAA